jgi:hypothetical protein
MYTTQPRLFCFTSEAPAAYQTPGTSVDEHPCTSVLIVPDLINQVYNDLVASLSEKQRRNMHTRMPRGLELALSGKVHFTSDPNTFIVEGHSHPEYTVDLFARTCDCPDCMGIPGNACKHRVAAYLIQKALELQPEPTPEPEPEPEPAAEQMLDAELDVDLDEVPEIINVTDVTYIALKFRGSKIQIELVKTDDGQVSARALGSDTSPHWINSANRQVIAEALAEYF